VPSAGYIQAYPPGVRENGGQYAHAGVWALMAQARLAQAVGATAADTDRPYRSFTWLSAAHRSAHPTRGPAYGLEPYVMAGDVYTQPPRVGRGGWSWYTGAAAWMHRAAVESIFGLQLDARELLVTPCLPTHWPRAELTLRRGSRTMRFIFVRGAALAAAAVQAEPGARPLQPGERLCWPELANVTCFVVPLPPISATSPVVTVATA
jgi:cyclic beta-1,2-glucan synthetase